MTVFSDIHAQGLNAHSPKLASGVWEALVCTAFGLAIAIPSYAGYNYLVSRVNSIVEIPVDARKMIVTLTTFLLSVALAAMGLQTDIARLYARGLRPAILGASAFGFIAGFSLLLVKLVG